MTDHPTLERPRIVRLSCAVLIDGEGRWPTPDGFADHACVLVAFGGPGRDGEVALQDPAQPMGPATPGAHREIRLYVQRAVFATRVGRIEALSGFRIADRHPLAALFVPYAGKFADGLPTMSAQDAAFGLNGLLHLLAGLLGAALAAAGDGGAGLKQDALLALADRHIEGLLGDPAFDAAALARALGVSRSRLYAAFAARGGVVAAIRDARLERARLRLADPSERHRTLEEIAASCGFADHPIFTRAFRRRFGLPPRDGRGG